MKNASYLMGENIAKRRMELGFTQEKAAELIGVSRQSYSRIERGKTRLVSKKLSKIADAFHCDENLIMLGYDFPFDPKRVESLLNEKDEEIVYAHKSIEELEQRIQILNEKITSQEKNIDILLRSQEASLRIIEELESQQHKE